MGTKGIVMALGLAVGMSLEGASGTNLVITSFNSHGGLTWTTELANASYEVQWSPSVSAPGWTNTWECLVGMVPTGATYAAAVPMFYRVVAVQPRLFDFSRYAQTDPNLLGSETWLVTNSGGSASRVTNEVRGFVRVPYASGAVYGVRIGDPSGPADNGSYNYNDGHSLWVLGRDGWFISSTSNLVSHAPCYRFAAVHDGMVITQSYYSVKADLSMWFPGDEITIIKVEDVTVPYGTFTNAIVMWRVDVAKPYVELDFQGQEQDLGITLPSRSEAGGHAVLEFRAFGLGRGRVAQGLVTPTNGVLYQLRTLLTVSRD